MNNESLSEGGTGMMENNALRGTEIAIVGIGVRVPGASKPEQLWANLRDGIESITRFSREDLEAAGVPAELIDDENYVAARPRLAGTDLFDAEFFGINPQEAKVMDPQQRLFLECAWEALEQAGYDPTTYPGLVGVFAGSDQNDYGHNNLHPNRQLKDAVGDFQLAIGNEKDYLPTQVSYRLNLHGPGVNVQTACSTSLVAVHLACQSILLGECDAAIAGGVAIQVPDDTGQLYQEGMIYSPDGHTRTFDADACGTIFGSGVGAVVLKRLEDALADGDTIHAVILGSAINNDGRRKIGFTAPSIEGQADVIARALAVADVTPESISYVEAHGTATTIGDPIEVASLTQAFGKTSPNGPWCGLGSVKTNMGHLGAAAGIAGLIKTVLALEHKQIPPSLHYQSPNPNIDFSKTPFFVNSALRDWENTHGPRRAGVNSFGIGGTNVHVVLQEAPPVATGATKRVEHLVVLSARTPAALAVSAKQLATSCRGNPDADLADIAFTLAAGRKCFKTRLSIVASSTAELVEKLDRLSERAYVSSSEDANLVFMFPGQGTQFVGMGWDLYLNEPQFASTVDYCCDVLAQHIGLDLRELIYPATDSEAGAKLLASTQYTQPALFVVEYALASLLRSWGIQPSAMIGHSIGEYVAACLSGVFSLEDALALVAARGRLMSELPAGGMLAIPLPVAGVEWLLKGRDVSLAAVNQETLCVVSGPTPEIERLREDLRSDGIECQVLQTSHAFHSAMMDPILPAFADMLGKLTLHAPRIPFVSNVTGTWITEADATDPAYWARHLRGTVRFAEGARMLVGALSPCVFEVGPGLSLSGGWDGLAMFARAKTPNADRRTALESVGKAWTRGVKLDTAVFYSGEQRKRIPLPTYPYERKRFWIEPVRNEERDVVGKLPNVRDWLYAPVWQQSSAIGIPGLDTVPAQDYLWVILGGANSLTDKLVERLEKKGAQVIVVEPGEHFEVVANGRFLLDAQIDEHYERLLKHLPEGHSGPINIVHAWLLTGASPSSTSDNPDEWSERGFYSVLRFAKAIASTGKKEQVRIAVVTNGASSVLDERASALSRATVIGACRVIPHEFDNIQCSVIDIHRDVFDWADVLVTELCGEFKDNVLAYHLNRRWLPQYEPIRLEAGSGPGSYIKVGGTYLITGGLGGLGLAVALHFATLGRINLILAGRSALPEREQWGDWLAEHDALDPTAVRIRAIEQIEALGAAVHVVAADVADLVQMRSAISEAEERVGPIQGIIHAAGVAGGGLIQLRSKGLMQGVLAPKVAGTLVLEKIFRDKQLDFFVLFSSLTAIAGKFGQADYTAANTFLDTFAAAQHGQNWTTCISINWDAWQDVGMAADTMVPHQMAEERERLLAGALTPAEGMEVLDRAIGSGLKRIVVSTRNLPARLKEKRQLSDLVGATALSSGASQASASTYAEYVAPTSPLEEQLVSLWEQLLGIAPIGIRDNFFDLGGHSLLAVNMMKKIEKLFGRVLTNADILEQGGNIEGMAKLLQQEPKSVKKQTVLVALQPGGDEVPFFCVHAIGGTAFAYAKLANALGKNQPLYALQARGHLGRPPHTSVEEMAAHYIAAIRAIQPEGPYCLGGWSLGGIIAFEMARQFAEYGEVVSLLVLVDTWLIDPAHVKPVSKERDLLQLFANDASALFGHVLSAEEQAILQESGADDVFALLFAWIPALNAYADGGLDYLANLYKVFVANLTAANAYCAKPLAQHTLLLSAATLSPSVASALATQGGDVTVMHRQGWDICLAEEHIKQIVVPGDHYTLLQDPIVDVIAQHIRTALKVERDSLIRLPA